ncbi:hypothetical protein LZ198_32590 [Myxococcus sp. K15C18031901]|uniref:hypothetical protein n=1 Tax=Myxococcus dinghuensis TaxID=2906761 RepID=UPI0020A70561|nr:hypothetical protein [Myxococcus dinghuensis]MCP3103633.1 hypothetical protein [Myxococcus dinghuensis]
MDNWRMVLAPLYAAFLAALVVVAFTYGRRGAAVRVPRVPFVWFGLLALGALLVVARIGDGRVWVSSAILERSLGAALLVLAALAAVRGTRVRSGAELLRASAPRRLDDAVAALRSGQGSGWGVYQGTLDAENALVSPGGVHCAFYEAEVREVAADGRKGPLLSRERAFPPELALRGLHSRATVRFSPVSLMASVLPRRCRELPTLARVSLREEASVLGSARAGGPAERMDAAEPRALSWECVGAAGDSCFVVGELTRGAAAGSFLLRGRGGGPALLVLGAEAEATRGTLARRAWRHFTVAATLSILAAAMLSRSM